MNGLEPRWLKRDSQIIDGLDHLGVEVVSVNLYATLLPGITNVTDRARYFAFYPWAIDRFAHEPGLSRSRRDWLNWIRTLDYTYALACAAYGRTRNARGPWSAAVVGNIAANRALQDLEDNDQIDLWAGARLDDRGKVPKRTYFKNSQGGLGQYYKAPLTLLGLAIEDPKLAHPSLLLTNYAGRPLADALSSQQAFQGLLDLTREGRATPDQLSTVGKLIHPGAIVEASEEEGLLRGLFLGVSDELCRGQNQVQRRWRRNTLLLLLRFAEAAGSVEGGFAGEFRWSCAARALPDGSPWDPPPALADVAEEWASYQRNDLLNYCLETIFWAALQNIAESRPSLSQLTRQISEWACAAVPPTSDCMGFGAVKSDVSSWLSQCHRAESEARDEPWDERSTWAICGRLDQALAEESPAEATALAVRLIGRIAGEVGDRMIFANLPAPEKMLAYREVHLRSLQARVATNAGQPFGGFVEDLALEWVLYRHLRVATAKLAAQGVSTFKFRPEEQTLTPTAESPMPTLTSPRLRQAHRILLDLHYLSEDEPGVTRLSDDGRALFGGLP